MVASNSNLWAEEPDAIRKLIEEEARRDRAPLDIGPSCVAPRTKTEEILLTVFGDILALEKLGVTHDFFSLGGHSILATQAIARVRTAFGVEVPLGWMIETPTVEKLAVRIDAAVAEGRLAQWDVNTLPQVVPSPRTEHEPFSLTDIQQAYWVGRGKAFELGNISTHIYMEFEGAGLDVPRLEAAWQKVVARHPMLRVVMDARGQQRVLDHVPPYRIAVSDVRAASAAERDARLETSRAAQSHQMFDTTEWPLFEIRAALLPNDRVRTSFSIDFLVVDAGSIGTLFREWGAFYANPALELPRIELTFRDYAATAARLRESPLYRRSQEYWWNRIPTLPMAPQLPQAKSTRAMGPPRFQRRSHRLDEPLWSRLKKQASAMEVTPSALLATVFGQVLATWSRSPRFTLNLTLFNRLPIHAQVDAVVGDFTSLTLLEMELPPEEDLKTQAKRVQARLWADLDHRYVSGVEVLREIGHRNQAVVLMPVVFTSTLGQTVPMNGESPLLGEEVYSISQTPQVSLDHQIFEGLKGELRYTWDSVEELFPAGMLDDMFEAYRLRLQQVADGALGPCPLLVPARQTQAYLQWNSTAAPAPDALLQDAFMERARAQPDAPAVISPSRTLTYGELAREARQLARRLRELGVKPNELVAVVMERGWEQVVAVIGVLESGAAYVPVDSELPPERRFHLLERCLARVVVTQPAVDAAGPWPEGVQRLRVEVGGSPSVSEAPLERAQAPSDLAYVLFTSGSTGTPKGVMIEHRSALNTIEDINQRHRVTAADRVLSLSSLSFDLSVYDIFGTLGAGGAVVQIGPGDLREPARWAELIERHRVTVWNSVPALMQMLLSYVAGPGNEALRSLRVAFWSGDWIPLGLADELKSRVSGVKAISMGGATEASIWSIDYPIGRVEAGWPSIPYGKPMQNQRWYVLDEARRVRPWWVPGELFIGGVGVARGYWRDTEKTNERFITHPTTGERLYRTGDWGRFLDTGNIEFLGREDGQVKIRGFRVELGEIEAVTAAIPGVKDALCVAYADASGQKSLAAYVVLAKGAALTDVALKARVAQKLPAYMVPAQVLFLEQMPLSANGKVDRKALPSPTAEASPEEYVAPRNEREQKMVAVWQDLLKRERIGVTDNFFRLGGNSLVAVSLVARAEHEVGVEFPLSTILDHPTIEGLLGSLGSGPVVRAKPRHLVTLNRGGALPPLVLMSGLGGHAFVFQGLARFLGSNQPVHVLTAIGAEDESEGLDHTIEEMAEIYEPEILAACGTGPVILGGYSFGMLVAYEIARRMQALGRAFPLLVSFDGFAPGFPKLQPLPQRLLSHARVFAEGKGPGRLAYLRDRVRAVKARINDRLGRSEQNYEAIPYANPDTDVRLRKMSAALWKSGLKYLPPSIASSDLLLVKTSIGEHWIGNDMDDPLYGWSSWVDGKIATVTVPGEHLRLFDEANQRKIADAIAHAISMHGTDGFSAAPEEASLPTAKPAGG